MLRNSAKSNWTLDELGWKLLPPGAISEWDGLPPRFICFLEDQWEHQKDIYLGRWFRAGNDGLVKGF
jgi:hypothetical protein